MADDLEAFLRQAAQRRVQRKKPARPTSTPPKPAPPRRKSVPLRPSEPDLIIEAEAVPPAGPLAGRPGISDGSKFEQRAEHLGDEVEVADDIMEAHLHAKFDHQLGELRRQERGEGARRVDASAPASQMAADVMQALRNPNSVRQAVILSEILSPPELRW